MQVEIDCSQHDNVWNILVYQKVLIQGSTTQNGVCLQDFGKVQNI